MTSKIPSILCVLLTDLVMLNSIDDWLYFLGTAKYNWLEVSEYNHVCSVNIPTSRFTSYKEDVHLPY